jgi:hypothetical protein
MASLAVSGLSAAAAAATRTTRERTATRGTARAERTPIATLALRCASGRALAAVVRTAAAAPNPSQRQCMHPAETGSAPIPLSRHESVGRVVRGG